MLVIKRKNLCENIPLSYTKVLLGSQRRHFRKNPTNASPQSRPIWIVSKKRDNSRKWEFRIVIDYRKLNEERGDDKYHLLDKLLHISRRSFRISSNGCRPRRRSVFSTLNRHV